MFTVEMLAKSLSMAEIKELERLKAVELLATSTERTECLKRTRQTGGNRHELEQEVLAMRDDLAGIFAGIEKSDTQIAALLEKAIRQTSAVLPTSPAE
jgi:hypothetical protein